MRRLLGMLAVLFLVATLAPAATAASHVEIGDEQVVVRHRGTAVVVDRAPFGLRFDGRAVLATVDNGRPPPTPLAVDPWRQPGGGEEEGQPPLYAPITFTVGDQVTQQYPGSYWSTDVLMGAAAGTQFNLIEVTDAQEVTEASN